MNYLRSMCTTLAFGLMLSGAAVPLRAIENLNYAEMGSALATIPLNIAANHFDGQADKVKVAALLHLATDTMNLANKILYFINRLDARDCNEAWDNRDYCYNGIIALRDLTKLYQHLKDSVHSPKKSQDKAKANEVQEASDETEIVQDTQLEHVLKVAGLPCLNGLMAFAIACTQDGVNWIPGNKNARFCASAAHLIVRAFEEYTELKANSQQKKLLGVAILLSFAMLVYEIWGYAEALNEDGNGFKNPDDPKNPDDGKDPKPVVDDKKPIDETLPTPEWVKDVRPAIDGAKASEEELELIKAGLPCPLYCGEEKPENCIRLACGHVICKDCLKGTFDTALKDAEKEKKLPAVRCPHPGKDSKPDCDHIINPIEIRAIVAGKNEDFNKFNDVLANGIIQMMHTVRVCPTNGCNMRYEKLDNVPRPYQCPGCNKRYCANCQKDHLIVKGAPCPTTDAAKKKAEDMASEAWKKAHSKQCPRCHVPVEKNGGCNNMHCIQCNHQFCWKCGADDYGHNHTMSSKCGLWN